MQHTFSSSFCLPFSCLFMPSSFFYTNEAISFLLYSCNRPKRWMDRQINSLVFYRTLVPLGPLPCIASPKITSLQFTNTLWTHGYGYISYMIDHEYLNLGNVKNGQKMRSSSSSHRINMGFSSFSKIQLKDKWHTHNKRLISQRSPAYPRLYHIPNKNIDPELSYKRNFSFSNFVRFFRLSPELEYANEIIAKLGILSHTLEMCEKSSAFELFHSFW